MVSGAMGFCGEAVFGGSGGPVVEEEVSLVLFGEESEEFEGVGVEEVVDLLFLAFF